jgi:hypothetical protein
MYMKSVLVFELGFKVLKFKKMCQDQNHKDNFFEKLGLGPF